MWSTCCDFKPRSSMDALAYRPDARNCGGPQLLHVQCIQRSHVHVTL